MRIFPRERRAKMGKQYASWQRAVVRLTAWQRFSPIVTRTARQLRRHRTPLVVTGIALTLWACGLLAATSFWRTEVPTIRIVRTSASIRAVVAPILFRRHPATSFQVAKHDGIRQVSKRSGSAGRAGISKRAGVQLTAKQAVFVKQFGSYLRSIGASALVTSGARSPQHQLAIIKSKIRSLGASGRFPSLRRASVGRPSTWMAAWQYLRARHVPVYAPAATEYGETSNHIRGLAVDMIAGSLDHLTSLVYDFAQSSFARHSPLRVVSVAREAGCVHINLTNSARYAEK